ncbi:MAG: CRISPR-associated endonuclease Cas2 [Alphaproteobacteria bacterium]|nr:CRISPR-associated endonuclease Cas2 [Alphaproteobacteria bacterium]
MPDGWRQMWLMVFYDLPVIEHEQRKAATTFHDFLIDEGFEMMHYSIYKRYCGTTERLESQERRVERRLPKWGNVMALRLTDRQMAGMKRWIGKQPDTPTMPPPQYRLF